MERAGAGAAVLYARDLLQAGQLTNLIDVFMRVDEKFMNPVRSNLFVMRNKRVQRGSSLDLLMVAVLLVKRGLF